MRGPLDDAIEAQQTPVAPENAVSAAPGTIPPRRPPGGKALIRLTQMLERAGFAEAAATAVDNAVRGEAKTEFIARARQFTVAPNGIPSYNSPAVVRADSETDSDTAGVDISAGRAAQDIGSLYLEVGQNLPSPPGPGPQWESLGPWTVPNGQTYGASRVNISGRVAAIAVDPGNASHVLCGAAHGGVWESKDKGASWAPRTDFAATLTVGALAFDRSAPSKVYCGTGEGNWWSWLGAGILRSTDGGTTWTSLCTAPFVGQGFYDLLVDPGNGNHLIAATTGGLYVSTNGGVAWTQRRSARTWSVSMAPAGGASAEILAACSDGIFRSTNGGTTWTAVTLPSAPGPIHRAAVAIAPSNPAVAYAWASDGAPHLWRRAGGTWTAITTPPGVSVGQDWYDWFLAAAPDHDTQVFCGAIDVHRGDLSGTTWTWTNLSSKSAGSSIHPDSHAIAFEPGHADTLYVGNDGGLFRSNDRGITWQHCNNGLVISEFEYLAQNYGSSRWLMGGTQDNGTERWTGSSTWNHIADGDGGDCGVNRGTPATVFHTFYNMSPQRSTTSGDFGSWSNITPSIPAGEGSLFYPPFECSATVGDTVALGGDAVYISRNNGTAWTRLAYPSAARTSAMYIPTPNAVYVGTTDGRIYHTSWNGSSWPALAALTTPRASANVSDLFVDPTNLNRMWATYSTVGGGRVYSSTNGGSAWTDRSAGLPALPINAFETDPANSNRVWVAADLGVYQSLDAGATWANFSNGLPNMFVGDLLFHPNARVLRAATRNRGVWQIPVDGWMTQPVCGTQFTGSLVANETRRWFTFNWPATWHIIWTVMPTSIGTAAQVSWKVMVQRSSAEFVTYWIEVKNLTNQPVTFEGRYCILSRY